MRIDLNETLWLDEHQEVSFSELVELSGMAEGELRQLIEYGALTPVRSSDHEWIFTTDCVVIIRKALRMRNDFDLEPEGLSLVMTLLERIRDLEAQLGSLEAQRPRRRS